MNKIIGVTSKKIKSSGWIPIPERAYNAADGRFGAGILIFRSLLIMQLLMLSPDPVPPQAD